MLAKIASICSAVASDGMCTWMSICNEGEDWLALLASLRAAAAFPTFDRSVAQSVRPGRLAGTGRTVGSRRTWSAADGSASASSA